VNQKTTGAERACGLGNLLRIDPVQELSTGGAFNDWVEEHTMVVIYWPPFSTNIE
jgi:hypothetical protein